MLSSGFGGFGVEVIFIELLGGVVECVDRGKLFGEFGLKILKFLVGFRLIFLLGGIMTTVVLFIVFGGVVCDCCCCVSLINLGGRFFGVLFVLINLICFTLKFIYNDFNILSKIKI